jgi:signal transduction histidine kinase
MRLRLASRFSALILAIFALALLSNLMALFAAWRVERRLKEIATADVPSADAADEFRTALQEERLLYTAFPSAGADNAAAVGRADKAATVGRAEKTAAPGRDEKAATVGRAEKTAAPGRAFDEWLKGIKRVESRLRSALHVMRQAADLFGSEIDSEGGLLAQLERAYAKIEARRNEAITLSAQGDKGQARALLLAAVNGPEFKEADGLCLRIATAADERVRDSAARVARRMHQATWVIGISGGLTICLGSGLLWLLFRRILIPLQSLVTDARLFDDTLHPSLDHSQPDEIRTVDAVFRGLMSDMTDTRSSLERSRSRLLAAEKLASVGKLAASVAHEIRNPLTAMKMWLFSLQESLAGNPDLRRKLEIISEEMTRLDHIVRDFLEFARPPALQRRACPIDAVIAPTLELLAVSLEEINVTIALELAPDLPAVMADPDQLRQVLINLLNNAVEAMTGGGEIRIVASVERDAEDRRMVVVRVRDSGGGMDEEVRSRAFEPFFSAKENGTGLGLCIAARIMAAHDGRLVLESSSPQGTTVAVWIPVAQQEAAGAVRQ